MQLTPEQMLFQAMDAAHAAAPIGRLAVAVSGGGDSTALLHLLRGWVAAKRAKLCVVTVDHGLRAESANEARLVARDCAALGIEHATLRWQGWDGQGNLQDAARRARYGLIGAWARGAGVGAVALGHTLDDQAETFLMRLARGSGVDGLSAMRGDWQADGLRWLRPLLDVSREALRDYLRAQGISWVDDPSNEDQRFDRVKARRALVALGPLGLGADRLAQTAGRMSAAREVLERAAHDGARALCTIDRGDVVFAKGFADLPRETRARLFAHALIWVASGEYRPRLATLNEALEALSKGEARTLHGCLVTPSRGRIIVAREYKAVVGSVAAPGDNWDRRWRLSGPRMAGIVIRALGEEGLLQCPDWRIGGLSRTSLLASPAVWRGDKLVAAPLAGFTNGWQAEIDHPADHFFTSLLSH